MLKKHGEAELPRACIGYYRTVVRLAFSRWWCPLGRAKAEYPVEDHWQNYQAKHRANTAVETLRDADTDQDPHDETDQWDEKEQCPPAGLATDLRYKEQVDDWDDRQDSRDVRFAEHLPESEANDHKDGHKDDDKNQDTAVSNLPGFRVILHQLVARFRLHGRSIH